jgi:3-phosphoshikimate 1-carboxyvinyltransferase
VVEIVPSGPLLGHLGAPPSKSVTNRLLVLAGLAAGPSRIEGPLESDDTEAMVEGLEALGVQIEVDGGGGHTGWKSLTLEGAAGRLSAPAEPIDARLSGTTLRFLAPLAVLARGRTTLDGAPPLRRRPVSGLAAALSVLGADVETDGGFPPLTVTGRGLRGLRGGKVRLDAKASSQFASAVLMAAPYADDTVELEVANLGASGFVDLTLQVMRTFGAVVEHEGDRYVVSAAERYTGRDESVEYDASAAAHLFALAMATGGEVTVTNVTAGSLQPDARVVDLFEEMGAVVSASEGELTVRGPEELRPVEADLSAMPDQLATVSTLAALADGTSRLSGLGVTRGHETDRISATAAELARLGAEVRTGEDWIEVRGGSLHGGDVETYDDHRMAMAFAALGARVPGVRLRGPGCVAKTYPRFFEDAAALGLVLRSAD